MRRAKHDPLFSGLETMDLPLVSGRRAKVEQAEKGSALVSVSKACLYASVCPHSVLISRKPPCPLRKYGLSASYEQISVFEQYFQWGNSFFFFNLVYEASDSESHFLFNLSDKLLSVQVLNC